MHYAKFWMTLLILEIGLRNSHLNMDLGKAGIIQCMKEAWVLAYDSFIYCTPSVKLAGAVTNLDNVIWASHNTISLKEEGL